MMMMGFDFGENRRDVRVGCDHGRVQLLVEGLEGGDLIRRGLLAGSVIRFQLLFLRGEARVGGDGFIMSRFQLGLLVCGEEIQLPMMMVTAFGRRIGGRIILCVDGVRRERPHG